MFNIIKFFIACRYDPSIRAEIGKYASQHGVAATARLYSRKLGYKVSETTANSLKKWKVSERNEQLRMMEM